VSQSSNEQLGQSKDTASSCPVTNLSPHTKSQNTTKAKPSKACLPAKDVEVKKTTLLDSNPFQALSSLADD